MISSKKTISADGEDTVCIEVLTVDGQGRIVPQNSPEITFGVEGPGRILGVGNGDPSCHEPDKAFRRWESLGRRLPAR